MKLKEKMCEFCGEPFIPASNFQRYCKRPHYMTCPVCGKQYLVTNNENLKRRPVACSYECRAARTRQTSLEKYGVTAPGNNPEARKKCKETNLAKYGVDCILKDEKFKESLKRIWIEKYGADNPMKNDDIKNKVARTCMDKYGSSTFLTSEEGINVYKKILEDKYGTDHPMHSEKIKGKAKATNLAKYGSEWFTGSEEGKQRIKNTLLDKYGVTSATQIEEVKAKMRRTFIDHYGVDNPSKNKNIVDKIKQTMISRYGTSSSMDIPEIREKIMKTTMDRYGVPFYVMLEECRKSSGAISKMNIRFGDTLEKVGINYRMEFRIDSLSYDFYLPDFNMLIELNPSYTHNMIGNHWDSKGKPANYHRDKWILAWNKGYDLRCIFDWDSAQNLLDELCSKRSEVSSVDDFSTYFLNRKVSSEFLRKYGRARSKHYPRKAIYIGLVKDRKIHCALAVSCSKSSERSYQVIDYGTIWSERIINGYQKLVDTLDMIISRNDVTVRIDADNLKHDDLKDFGINESCIEIELPSLVWSKGTKTIPARPNVDTNSLIQDGWLPVENCGYACFNL